MKIFRIYTSLLTKCSFDCAGNIKFCTLDDEVVESSFSLGLVFEAFFSQEFVELPDQVTFHRLGILRLLQLTQISLDQLVKLCRKLRVIVEDWCLSIDKYVMQTLIFLALFVALQDIFFRHSCFN